MRRGERKERDKERRKVKEIVPREKKKEKKRSEHKTQPGLVSDLFFFSFLSKGALLLILVPAGPCFLPQALELKTRKGGPQKQPVYGLGQWGFLTASCRVSTNAWTLASSLMRMRPFQRASPPRDSATGGKIVSFYLIFCAPHPCHPPQRTDSLFVFPLFLSMLLTYNI